MNFVVCKFYLNKDVKNVAHIFSLSTLLGTDLVVQYIFYPSQLMPIAKCDVYAIWIFILNMDKYCKPE